MNRNSIVYRHPVIGNVTIGDILEQLKSAVKESKQFEDIAISLLEDCNVPKDTIYSLYVFLNASLIEELIDELDTFID